MEVAWLMVECRVTMVRRSEANEGLDQQWLNVNGRIWAFQLGAQHFFLTTTLLLSPCPLTKHRFVRYGTLLDSMLVKSGLKKENHANLIQSIYPDNVSKLPQLAPTSCFILGRVHAFYGGKGDASFYLCLLQHIEPFFWGRVGDSSTSSTLVAFLIFRHR